MWATIISLVALAISATMMAIGAKRSRGPEQSPNLPEAPTAEEGASIPVLFGTRDIRSPNVVWYGDVEAKPVKSKTGKKG